MTSILYSTCVIYFPTQNFKKKSFKIIIVPHFQCGLGAMEDEGEFGPKNAFSTLTTKSFGV